MPNPNPVLIAVDTNVVLDFAKTSELIIDCFATIRQRIPSQQIIVLPTVIQELTDIACDGDTEEEKSWATQSLQCLIRPWNFRPVNCVPVGHGIVESIGRKLRERKLIPDEEVNDSFVLAEAALLSMSILLSSDGHLWDIDKAALKILLDECHVSTPILTSPWKIVNEFFLR